MRGLIPIFIPSNNKSFPDNTCGSHRMKVPKPVDCSDGKYSLGVRTFMYKNSVERFQKGEKEMKIHMYSGEIVDVDFSISEDLQKIDLFEEKLNKNIRDGFMNYEIRSLKRMKRNTPLRNTNSRKRPKSHVHTNWKGEKKPKLDLEEEKNEKDQLDDDKDFTDLEEEDHFFQIPGVPLALTMTFEGKDLIHERVKLSEIRKLLRNFKDLNPIFKENIPKGRAFKWVRNNGKLLYQVLPKDKDHYHKPYIIDEFGFITEGDEILHPLYVDEEKEKLRDDEYSDWNETFIPKHFPNIPTDYGVFSFFERVKISVIKKLLRNFDKANPIFKENIPRGRAFKWMKNVNGSTVYQVLPKDPNHYHKPYIITKDGFITEGDESAHPLYVDEEREKLRDDEYSDWDNPEPNKPESEPNKPESEPNKPESEPNKPESEPNKPESGESKIDFSEGVNLPPLPYERFESRNSYSDHVMINEYIEESMELNHEKFFTPREAEEREYLGGNLKGDPSKKVQFHKRRLTRETFFSYNRDTSRFTFYAPNDLVEYISMPPKLNYVLGFEQTMEKIYPGTQAKYMPDITAGISKFFIYENTGLTDLAIVGDKMASLLCVVNVDAPPGKNGVVHFDPPIYHRIIKDYIDEAGIDIRTSDGSLVKFNDGDTMTICKVKYDPY